MIEILTTDGFKSFKDVKLSKKSIGVTFHTASGKQLSCTQSTKVMSKGRKWVVARSLDIGDFLGEDEIITKIEHIVSDFYDIIEVEDVSSFIANKDFNVHNCAFIPNYSDFSNSIIPTISSSKTSKIVMTSTPCGLNHWYDLWMDAEEGKTEYKNYKINWWDVPGRDEAWKDHQIKILKGGARAFAQEYACEFLGSSDTLVDIETLTNIKPKDPISTEHNNQVFVYEEPKENNHYIMTADPAKGGGDLFAIHIIDVTTMPFRQVLTACFKDVYLKLPVIIMSLLQRYNNPLLVIENNEGAGTSICDILFNVYEYENIYRDPKKSTLGVRTTKMNRDRNLSTMKWVLENKKLVINDKTTLDQLFTFVNTNGKYQAQQGKFDDCVMSLALLFVVFDNVKYLSDYNTFVEQMSLKEEEDEKEANEFIELLSTSFFYDGTSINDGVNNSNKNGMIAYEGYSSYR